MAAEEKSLNFFTAAKNLALHADSSSSLFNLYECQIKAQLCLRYSGMSEWIQSFKSVFFLVVKYIQLWT